MEEEIKKINLRKAIDAPINKRKLINEILEYNGEVDINSIIKKERPRSKIIKRIVDKIKVYGREPDKLYEKDNLIKFLKILIQMLIGASIIGLIVLEMIGIKEINILGIQLEENINELIKMSTLGMVSKGLGVATGIELAYMLFTDGPDEAVQPVLMAVASFVIYQMSAPGEIEGVEYIGVALLILLIPVLFWVKGKYIDSANNNKRQGEE